MSNVIIVIILLIAVVFGMKETVKHFKGEGACCGGGSSKPKRKKLEGKVVCKYAFRIEGMHCGNCANAVTRAINDIDGAVAKVSLNKKTAIVSCYCICAISAVHSFYTESIFANYFSF